MFYITDCHSEPRRGVAISIRKIASTKKFRQIFQCRNDNGCVSAVNIYDSFFMPIYLTLLILFIVSLLESTFIHVPLTLLAIVALGVIEEKPLEMIVFAAGIILDILGGRPMGLDSLIFLFVLLLILSYRKKIVAYTFYYLIPFSTILIVLYTYIFYKKITLPLTIASIGSGILLFFIISVLTYRFGKSSKLTI